MDDPSDASTTTEESPHEIEVTPTDSVESDDVSNDPSVVNGPRYLLYGGKGGVGKTTIAAASALASAQDGLSTLIISTDPAHSLSDIFETQIEHRPDRIFEDIPLFGMEIDPSSGMDDRSPIFDQDGPSFGPLDELFDDSNPMDVMFGQEMPGADEMAAFRLLLDYYDDDRYDRIVVDTAPTGHTLRLLELPETMDSMIGRVLTLRERLSGLFDGVKEVLGTPDTDDGSGLEELRRLRSRIERFRTVLRDDSVTDFRLVMVPETMSVRESVRLQNRLRSFEVPVGTIVVNRVLEPISAIIDIEDESIIEADVDGCAFCQTRWDVQRTALSEAQRLFQGTNVVRIPLFASEVKGRETLQLVAECIDAN